MNEWKAKVEALKAQREAGSRTRAASDAVTPSSRFGSPTSTSPAPRAGPNSTSTPSGDVCEKGHPMSATGRFCPSCGSRKAVASSTPTVTTSTTPSSPSPVTSPSPSQATPISSPSTTSGPTSTFSSTRTTTTTPSSTTASTPSSTTASTPSSTTSTSSSSSALSRFKTSSSSLSEMSRSSSSPNLNKSMPTTTSTTSSSSASISSSSSSSSNIPQLTGTPDQQLEQLKALFQAKSNECDQLKNKLMAGLPSIPTGSSSPSSSQTALLEGKVKSLETKIASEIRQREMVEKRLEATKQELDDMKKRREAARARVQTKATADVTAAKARTAVAAQESAIAARGGAGTSRGGVRNSVRQSTRMGAAPKGPAIGDLVTKILTEMARVEAAIKKAEEDRQTAENELLEVACFKQAAEDRFGELTELVQQMVVHINTMQIIIATKCGAAPAVKEALVDLHGKLDGLVTRAGAIAKGAAATNTAEVTRIAMAVGAPPPPPPPGLVMASAPSSSTANARASTILTQIRKGTTLRTLDSTAIKREREEKAKNHRQSVSILNSLQDTLKAALNTRHGDMNPDSDDDDTWTGDY